MFQTVLTTATSSTPVIIQGDTWLFVAFIVLGVLGILSFVTFISLAASLNPWGVKNIPQKVRQTVGLIAGILFIISFGSTLWVSVGYGESGVSKTEENVSKILQEKYNLTLIDDGSVFRDFSPTLSNKNLLGEIDGKTILVNLRLSEDGNDLLSFSMGEETPLAIVGK